MHCEHEDVVMRFKEYERERRLKIRELILAGKDLNGQPLAVETTQVGTSS